MITTAMLDAAQQHADPAADEIVTRLIERTGVLPPADLMQFLMRLLHQPSGNIAPNDPDAGLAQCLQAFVQSGIHIPDWADDELIECAQLFFADHALDITSVLFYCALPTCYACGDGAKVVRQTERLVSLTHRRTSETAQFLFDVMSYGRLTDDAHPPKGTAAFDEGKRAYHSIAGVRLMHAAVRGFVGNSIVDHTPVNQQELLGTILAFSTVTTRGLERVGIEMAMFEQRAYWHLWSVVGSMLGITEHLIHIDLDEAYRLTDVLEERLTVKTVEGAELINALLGDMHRSTISILGWLGRPLRRVHPALITHLCSRRVAEALNLQSSLLSRTFVASTRMAIRSGQVLRRNWAPFNRVANHVAKRVLIAYTNIDRGNGRAPFDFGTVGQRPTPSVFAKTFRRYRRPQHRSQQRSSQR